MSELEKLKKENSILMEQRKTLRENIKDSKRMYKLCKVYFENMKMLQELINEINDEKKKIIIDQVDENRIDLD
jgi:hypothetical protein